VSKCSVFAALFSQDVDCRHKLLLRVIYNIHSLALHVTNDILRTITHLILGLELQHKSIGLPPCFDRWINLKDDSMFKRHFGHEPRGGLRACVESVGASWEGRAHNGLVDSINTAKIVRCMVQTGFRFTRSTRGLDKDGLPFGLKKRNGEKTRVMQKGRDEN